MDLLRLMGCPYCGSSKNLNTVISIDVDNSKISVSVCDDHADDATRKGLRDIILKMKEELSVLDTKARLMGYMLVPIEKKIPIVKIQENKDGGDIGESEQSDLMEYGVKTLDARKTIIGGAEVDIPSKLVDSAGGSTEIFINPNNKASAIINSMKQDRSYGSGYGHLKECTMCKSTGVIRRKSGDIKCPKCIGSGYLNS